MSTDTIPSTESVELTLVFVDDSGQSKPSRPSIGPLISLGAALVPQEHLVHFIEKIDQVRESLNVPTEVEIKWSPSAKDSWLRNPHNSNARTQLYNDTLDAALECGVRSIVVTWDQGAIERPEEVVKRELLKWIYERASRCLSDMETPGRGVRKIGLVITDIPGGDRKDEKRWLADTLELTNYGTEYVPRDRIQLPIMTGWSHHIPHLQLADLVTSITTAAVAGSEYATRYVPKLIKLAHTDQQGHLSGVGLKFYPLNSLGNLYHHIFGQHTAWDRGGTVRLPYSGWKFGQSPDTP